MTLARRPRLGEAMAVAARKLGMDAAAALEDSAAAMLE